MNKPDAGSKQKLEGVSEILTKVNIPRSSKGFEIELAGLIIYGGIA